MAVRPPGLIRPEDVAFVAGAAEVPAYTPLDEREVRRFDRDLVKTAGYYHSNRDLFSLFLEDRDFYLFAAQVAKNQLGGAFEGAVPSANGIGIQIIRSKTVLGTASWFRTFAAAGWGNVIGSAGAPVDLSTTSTTYGNPQNRVLLAFPKLGDLTVPKVTEVWFHIGPSDYPIWPIKFASLTDTYVSNLPHSVLIQKNSSFYTRGNVEGANVLSALHPFGLTIALGSYITGPGQE
ncbi:MAG: hypothetical protein QXE50_05810 [Nitrososphaerota archaeon]